MAAIGLFRGPAHLLEYANEEFAERARRLRIPIVPGVPSRELFTASDELALAMDRVYRTGLDEHVILPTGHVRVGPYVREGRRVGVWTRFVPLPRSLPARRRAPRVGVG